MSDDQEDGRETHEDVDDLCEYRREICDEVDAGDADETPVDASDNDEDERDRVQCFHVCILIAC